MLETKHGSSSASSSARIDCATRRAQSGASRIPLRKWPVLTQRLRSGGSGPMYGQPSGVPGRSPAQARLTDTRRSSGTARTAPRHSDASASGVTDTSTPACSVVLPISTSP